MEAATEAPAERTVEATEPALEDTVLRQDDMIRSELGSSPFLPPFPRLIPPRRSLLSSRSPSTGARSGSGSAAPTTPATRPLRRPSAIAASGAGEAQYHPSAAPPLPPIPAASEAAIRLLSSAPSPSSPLAAVPLPLRRRPEPKPTTPWLRPFPFSLSSLLLSCAYLPPLPFK